MTDLELEDKLREDYTKAVLGTRKARSLEEALQEALDNTTPERAGEPDYTSDTEQDAPVSEWI